MAEIKRRPDDPDTIKKVLFVEVPRSFHEQIKREAKRRKESVSLFVHKTLAEKIGENQAA